MKEQPEADDVRWNLDDLVPPPADRGIESILTEAELRMDAFAARYRGRVAALAAALRDVLDREACTDGSDEAASGSATAA